MPVSQHGSSRFLMGIDHMFRYSGVLTVAFISYQIRRSAIAPMVFRLQDRNRLDHGHRERHQSPLRARRSQHRSRPPEWAMADPLLKDLLACP